MPAVTRAIVLWCPDWPVIAARAGARAARRPPAGAGRRKGLVFACSAAARADGVKRGLRDARGAGALHRSCRCIPYDPVLDARAFEPVLAAIEEITPGVQPVRPGTCVLRARGPARYYGGEEQAAAELLRCLEGLGIAGCAGRHRRRAVRGRAGRPHAPGRDARAHHPGRRLPRLPGAAAGGACSATPTLTPLLRRLGIHTLGDLAALDPHRRAASGSASGASTRHTLASGLDGAAVVPRTPPKQLDRAIEFEPPLDRVDQVTFAVPRHGGAVHRRAHQGRTGVHVAAHRGDRRVRPGQRAHLAAPAAVLGRRTWSTGCAGSCRARRDRLRAGVADRPGACVDARERSTTSATTRTGCGAAGPTSASTTASPACRACSATTPCSPRRSAGGRALAERQVLVPWGDRPVGVARADRPWPGSLPAPAPSTVFEVPRPVARADRGRRRRSRSTSAAR